MQLEFYKYQGTGNDFVMIDNRKGFFSKENSELLQFRWESKFHVW